MAVQRLYEGQRRQVLNAREENVQRAELADKKKKFRARRERVSLLAYTKPSRCGWGWGLSAFCELGRLLIL